MSETTTKPSKASKRNDLADKIKDQLRSEIGDELRRELLEQLRAEVKQGQPAPTPFGFVDPNELQPGDPVSVNQPLPKHLRLVPHEGGTYTAERRSKKGAAIRDYKRRVQSALDKEYAQYNRMLAANKHRPESRDPNVLYVNDAFRNAVVGPMFWGEHPECRIHVVPDPELDGKPGLVKVDDAKFRFVRLNQQGKEEPLTIEMPREMQDELDRRSA